MIWHIFRKDWKLLWWKALVAAALMVIAAIAQTAQGHFGRDASEAVSVPAILGIAAALFLVTELVQLDPLAGAGQDWIARPIGRVDLLLAKILFILLTLGLPMLLAEVLQDLAGGVPFGKALMGATFDMVSGILSIGLPVLAFASLFRNLTQTMAAVFIAIVGLFATGLAIQGTAHFPLTGAEAGSGVQWMVDLTESAFYLVGALVIFSIQYFHRRTILARGVAAGIFLLVCFTPLLPWDAAFAVEQRLSPMPGAGANMNISFNPPSVPGHGLDSTFGRCIPIAVSGVSSGSWLNIDSAEVSLLGKGGQVLWSKRISQETLASRSFAASQKLRGAVWLESRCQPTGIPLNVWNQPSRVRIDYSLTLFARDQSYAMPAWNGDERMPGVGWCKTRMDGSLEFGCISEHKPDCFEVRSPYAPEDADVMLSCKPNYDAIRGGPDVTPWQLTLPLPVSRDDKLVLTTYQPLDHFTRQVTTPPIMPDWRTTNN